MAAELEKLAKQFSLIGNNDIANGVSAWAEVARSRGIETFEETPKKKTFLIKEQMPIYDIDLAMYLKEGTPGQMEEAAGLPHRTRLETKKEKEELDQLTIGSSIDRLRSYRKS